MGGPYWMYDLETQADYAEEEDDELGQVCPACNGNDRDGYDNCEFGGSDVYEPGPGSEDTHGCPRMTGTF